MPPTAAGVTQTPIATPCGHFAALRLVRSTFGLRGFPPSFALRRISRSSGALLDTRFASKSGDGRKDKALTTMPSRLRDKSGHRRKAFLLSAAYKRRSKSSRLKAQYKTLRIKTNHSLLPIPGFAHTLRLRLKWCAHLRFTLSGIVTRRRHETPPRRLHEKSRKGVGNWE